MTTALLAQRPTIASQSGERPARGIALFEDIRRSDVARVGGKGANLGEMMAAGLPVPPGFVLTIDAYERFYEANKLGPRVEAALKHIDPDNPAALESTAKRLRQLILDGTVPDDLRTEIEQAYAALAAEGTL